MDNLTAKTDIANLMWSFENLDVKAEDYTTKLENILKSINDLRTAEVTTTMSPEKVDQWNNYVTGLENIIRTRSEADDYVRKVHKILKSIDDLRTGEVTTLMDSEKLVQWNKYVTALEDMIRGCTSDSTYDELRTRARNVRSAVTLFAAASEGLEFIPVIVDDLDSRDNDSDTDSLPPLEMNNTMKRYPDEDVVYDDLPGLEKRE